LAQVFSLKWHHATRLQGQEVKGQNHVTYSVKIAITQYWVILSTSYFGGWTLEHNHNYLGTNCLS